MKLTDKEAIKALKRVRICELEEMVDEYPEDERDGRTDWEMIANEAGWLLDSYNSYGETVRAEDLEECREILRESQGDVVFYLAVTGKPYNDREATRAKLMIQRARNTVNEYNRLVRFVKKLKGMGLYCPYC